MMTSWSLRRLAAGVAAVVCIGLPVSVAAGDWDGGEHAPLLTPANFDGHLAGKRKEKHMCLVMFHVSWCKVCQRSFPEFVAAASNVTELELGVDFAHVDCTDEKELCARFSVKGYPTIKLFSVEEGVEPRTFKSQRSVAGFVKYAQRMTLPAVREYASAQELETALNNETLAAFVAAIPSGKPNPAGLEKAAKAFMDRHIFASTPTLGDLLPKEVGSPPADAKLAVLSLGKQQWPGHDNTSQPKPAVAYYRGSLDDEDAVSAWVERNRFPGVWALGEANFYEFTHANRPATLLADDPAIATKDTEAAYRQAAAELSEEFIFGAVDGKSWSEELGDFNIYTPELPRLLVVESNFEVWVEDIDALRAASAAADLRSLVDGAPILRQSRNTMSKVFFYYREAQRLLVATKEHAVKGPLEAFSIVLIVLLVVCISICFFWGLYKLFAILFSDPEEHDFQKKTR